MHLYNWFATGLGISTNVAFFILEAPTSLFCISRETLRFCHCTIVMRSPMDISFIAMKHSMTAPQKVCVRLNSWIRAAMCASKTWYTDRMKKFRLHKKKIFLIISKWSYVMPLTYCCFQLVQIFANLSRYFIKTKTINTFVLLILVDKFPRWNSLGSFNFYQFNGTVLVQWINSNLEVKMRKSSNYFC